MNRFVHRHLLSPLWGRRYIHSNQTFKSVNGLSPLTLKAFDKMKFEYLTKVQHATLPTIMEGKDVLARAKTGTGKSIAFLLPMIENIVIQQQRKPISALVLSPTRELATQIETEAAKLTTFHNNVNIGCFIGGTSVKKDENKLATCRNLDIIVATPGRLLDLLQRDAKNLVSRLSLLQFLALDEADRLLDMGFKTDLEKIFTFLPKQRQTLCFSATLPDSLQEIRERAFRNDHVFIDTVEKDDHDTNQQVVQEYLVCSIDQQIKVLEYLIESYKKENPDNYKIMVFFPAARLTGFMAELFSTARYPIIEMHSRKSQPYRTKAADRFRKGKTGIMFSSDVSARGVDYPGVTNVIQMGLTTSDDYTHRIGRTARAGTAGKGILVLADFEKKFLKDLSHLPLIKTEVPDFSTFRSKTEGITLNLKQYADLRASGEKAYLAFIGFYNTHLRRLQMDKNECIQMAAKYSRSIGFIDQVPEIPRKLIGKMGLKGVDGIRTSRSEFRSERERNGSSNHYNYRGNNNRSERNVNSTNKFRRPNR